jgi:hypothetical protein
MLCHFPTRNHNRQLDIQASLLQHNSIQAKDNMQHTPHWPHHTHAAMLYTAMLLCLYREHRQQSGSPIMMDDCLQRAGSIPCH